MYLYSMGTVWKEILLASTLLAFGTAKSVDRQASELCNAIKFDILETVEEYMNRILLTR